MIYLASIPRSGSTYLTRCIANLPPGPYTPKNIHKQGIYKTHRPADHFQFTEYDTKLFLFGDPILSVISTKKHRYEANHFQNCGAEWPPEDSLFRKDILGYERLFDTWTTTPGTLCLRYERLGTYQQTIASVLGRQVRWNDLQPRTTTYADVGGDTLQQIRDTYADLITKIENAQDCWIVE